MLIITMKIKKNKKNKKKNLLLSADAVRTNAKIGCANMLIGRKRLQNVQKLKVLLVQSVQKYCYNC